MKSKISALGLVSLLLIVPAAHATIEDPQAKELMKKGGCGACHTVKSKVVGPAYKDVAAKHKGEADAIAKLSKIVRAGSKGSYGPIPMPPVGADKISDTDLNDLLDWILSK